MRHSAVSAILHELVQLAMPTTCVVCAAAGAQLCHSCRLALTIHPRMRTLADGLRVYSSGDYDAAGAAILRAVKGERAPGLLRHLAPLLSSAVQQAASGRVPLALVPIPQTGRAFRARGFSVVVELMRRAQLPACPALVFTRTPADQRSLSQRERVTNMAGVFGVRDRRLPSGVEVVLIDDVVTSGATLMAAAAALRQRGVVVHGAATALATPRTTDQGAQPRPS